MHDLDSIDLGILRDLQRNCRTTYQVMAEKYGISVNAIKHRIERLQEKGVIINFVVFLSHAMANTNPFFALAYSSHSLSHETFINAVGNHRLVSSVGFDSYGSCVITGNYRFPEDLSELSEFIRGFEEVRDCEIHPIPTNRGGMMKLSPLHLKVIKSLRDNPRKPITSISKECGLTSRRVRGILKNLIEENIIRLTIQLNPNAGDTIWVSFRISWNPRMTTGAYIHDKFQKEYPDKFFQENRSATEPLMWAHFLVERVNDSESIAHVIKSIPSARIESTILPFPARVFPDLLSTILDEMLDEAKLL